MSRYTVEIVKPPPELWRICNMRARFAVVPEINKIHLAGRPSLLSNYHHLPMQSQGRWTHTLDVECMDEVTSFPGYE